MSLTNCDFPLVGRKTADSIFDYLIPLPRNVEISPGHLAFDKITGVKASPELAASQARLGRLGAWLNWPLRADANGNLELKINPVLSGDGWRLQVTPTRIEVSGGTVWAVSYAVNALIQLLLLAGERGLAAAQLPCGTVADQPSFNWRGFLLDSARQRQSAATIIDLLELLAAMRINVFHWHLTDDTGWRIDTASTHDVWSDGGGFTVDEIRAITAHAASLGIKIVPEIDIPGHSRHLLRHFPEFACDPANPGREFCLGKPEGRAFVKKIITEVAALFPESEYIHLGGDESGIDDWSKCPHCQAAMQHAGCRDFRQLERDFMQEMAYFVQTLGKTPIVWGTEELYDVNTVIQPWTHLSELSRFAGHGNRVINAICGDFYLDYPENPAVPAESWMMTLDEATLYRTDPCPFWDDDVRQKVLGSEGCLWTELVPEWRIMAKLRPRLLALSEVTWGKLPDSDYFDYLRRALRLSAAGYWEWLTSR